MFIDNIRQLVAAARLPQALTALLQEAQQRQLTDMQTGIGVLQTNLASADRNKMLGMMSDGDHRVVQAQTSAAILHFLNELTKTNKTILFASANPLDSARLQSGKEWDMLREEMTNNAAGYTLLPPLAATNRDWLKNEILVHKPTVIHISGHGLADGVVLESASGDGTSQTVRLDGFLRISEVATALRCVILSACYSQKQALDLAEQLKNTEAAVSFIACAEEIEDSDAILFAQGFYMGLANNLSFRSSFESGCDQIRAEGSGTVVPVWIGRV